jgi:hypothetical protein
MSTVACRYHDMRNHNSVETSPQWTGTKNVKISFIRTVKWFRKERILKPSCIGFIVCLCFTHTNVTQSIFLTHRYLNRQILWINSELQIQWHLLICHYGRYHCGGRFDPRGVFHMGFEMAKVALGQVCLSSTLVLPYQYHSTDAPILPTDSNIK